MNLPLNCPLCASEWPGLLWEDAQWRVIWVDEPGYPGFFRVVARDHVAEFTDLSPEATLRCIRLVQAVERVVRDEMQPDKVNLASLGNMVPHLHWHVIARYRDDAHFPAPIWATPCREVPAERLQCWLERLPATRQAITRALAALG